MRSIRVVMLGAALAIIPAIGGAQSAPSTPDVSPAVDDPRADLWVQLRGLLIQLDGDTGDVVPRLTVSSPACRFPDDSAGFAQSTATGVWLVNLASEGETPRPCAVWVSPDGGRQASYSLRAPDGERVLFRSYAANASGLWMVGQPVRQDGTTRPEDGSLYRIDQTTGSFEKVVEHVASVSAVDGGLGVVFTRGTGRSTRFLAGVIPTGASTPERLHSIGALSSGYEVVGDDGHLLFFSPSADRTIGYDLLADAPVAFDPPRLMATRFLPRVSRDGVWLHGRLRDGQGFLRFGRWDGTRPLTVPDPCAATAGCLSYWAATSPGGAWLVSGQTDDGGKLDWPSATLTRIDARTLRATSSVDGAIVSRAQGLPVASPTALPNGTPVSPSASPCVSFTRCPLPKSTPLPRGANVVITQVRATVLLSDSRDDDSYIVVTFRNEGTAWARLETSVWNLADRRGKKVGLVTVASTWPTPPGEVGYAFGAMPHRVRPRQAQLESASFIESVPPPTTGLVVSHLTTPRPRRGWSGLRVRGRVTNESGSVVCFPEVHLIYVGAKGKVVAIGEAQVGKGLASTSRLDSGETQPIESYSLPARAEPPRFESLLIFASPADEYAKYAPEC